MAQPVFPPMTYKLTYSTMFDPPAEMHQRFDAAVERIRQRWDQPHCQQLFINGEDRQAANLFERRSPINKGWLLGQFPDATGAEVDSAVSAARDASTAWRRTPFSERKRILWRVGELIEERVYDIAAAVAFEVGKNRMEALGEIQESADFFYYYCNDYERRQFDHSLPDDPLPDYKSHNRSVMKPYGVWAVINPFNFPFALAAGPVAAALVTGNTVVLKGATDTPWAGRLLADCVRDAGIPPGVFNYLCGSGRVAGEVLTSHPDVAGITFTGSHDVGMRITRKLSSGAFTKPCIAEMGGKNPVIVTANADLERAATGIVRSAYGLSGQKCSATSRIYVDQSVVSELVDRIRAGIEGITIGDPTRRENWLGPVINAKAHERYANTCRRLRKQGGDILAGGGQPADGELGLGYFCAPCLAEVPLDDPIWRQELFMPFASLARVHDREQAMHLANATPFGLTAGFYGAEDEVDWFLDNIEAGVLYVNRPQGATTGAWPGYQAFGGWKGSTTTGKAIASDYYLANYQREQSHTIVE